MKQGLDERQKREVDGFAAKAFYVMFAVGALGIVVQLFLPDCGLAEVAGETAALLAGGITCLAGSMKTGNFSLRGKPASAAENLLGSIVCSGIFSVFYGIVISARAADGAPVGKLVGGFFVGISVLCFLVLQGLGKYSAHVQKKREREYED